ncbi:MAG: HTTM domain-containing protein [Candidatus Omnitrophica bacterium]|nr:HTTM domain-containing protein [Candidatus Omnitrophota bacterium]
MFFRIVFGVLILVEVVRYFRKGWIYTHFIAAGFLYRVSVFMFFIGFAHIFLIEQGYYLNYFYLLTLVSFPMISVPAHRVFLWTSSCVPA